MADEGEDEQISRRMASLRIPKKQNKALPSNIARWSSSPAERVFPRRWFTRGYKRFDEFIEEGDSKESDFMRNLRDSRAPMTLPLSGEKIRIEDDGDIQSWTVRAKEFGERDDRDFYELRKHLQPVNMKLRVHRNTGKSEPPELSWGELSVFLKASNFIHKAAHSVEADILSRDPQNKRLISGEIDANFLGCLLALETLHPGPVLGAMTEFLIRIEKNSRRVASISEDLFDLKYKYSDDLNKLSVSSKKILKVIGKNLDKISKSSDQNQISLVDCMAICKAFDEIESLTASTICSLVIGGPPSSRNERFRFFKFIGARPLSIQMDDEAPFGILDDRISEFIFRTTALYWELNQEDIVSGRAIDENSIKVKFPEELIREDLADETTPGGSWLQEFEDTTVKFQQISAVITDSKGETDIAKAKIDEMSKHISSIKNKGVTFVQILDVLANNPTKYQEDYVGMAERTSYESLSDAAIGELEKFATGGNTRGSLQQTLEELGIDPNKSMELFQLILRKKDKTKELERRAHREFAKVSMSGTVASRAEWSKIELAKEGISECFEEGMRDLRRSDEKDRTQIERNIRKFITALISSINKLESICESILGGVTVERGNGALLVGMGQGGQQILRAMIANLMNTAYDDRSRNMLRAIGMSVDDVKRVQETMVDYHGKVEKISRSTKDQRDRQVFQELKSIFDECNVLALNLGPEIKELMDQSYSFVWGSEEPDATKNKKNVIRLSRNLLLLDPDEAGAGGKLGKGRAFADQAKDDISQVLSEYRDRRKRITHVALIHSFAGGSGSGMILPMLTEMKLQFPAANIWTFSAGPGTDDAADFGDANITYITSDILQSHYNALHHRAEDIDIEVWEKFCSGAKESQKNMRQLWNDTLEPWFGPIKNQSRHEQRYNEFIEKNRFGFTQLKGKEGSFKEEEWGWDKLVPTTPEQIEVFQEAIRDRRQGVDADEAYRKWARASEDPMQRLLHSETQKDGFNRADTDREAYPVSMTHVRRLMSHFQRIEDWKRNGIDPEEGRLAADSTSKELDKDPLMTYAIDHAEPETTSEDVSFQTDEGEYDNSIVREALSSYADSLQNFQFMVEEMGEKIAMNRGVNDDNKIKHFIVSNDHLDTSAGSLTKGVKHEIYNSTMVDTLVNVTHSLVAEMSLDLGEGKISLGGSSAQDSTAQTMDLSDMSRRTKPIASALSVDLSTSSSEVSFNTRYDRESYIQTISKVRTLMRKCFSSLFTDKKSPLFDNELDNDLSTEGEYLDALCYNLFAGEELLKNNPYEVIAMLRDVGVPAQLEVKEGNRRHDLIKELYNEAYEEIDDKESDFGIEEFANMARWMLLIPPRIIRGYMGADRSKEIISEFNECIREWGKGHEVFESEMKGDHSKEGRITLFRNEISIRLRNAKVDSETEEEDLANMFIELGILDTSHLAIIPSAFIADSASWALFNKDLESDLLVQAGLQSPEAVVEILGSPTGSIELSENRAERKDRSANGITRRLDDIEGEIGKVSSLLRVKSTGWENNERNLRVIETSTRFTELMSTLKHSIAELHPETATYSLVDLLVTRGSNPGSRESKTANSEKPEFRLVRKDLARMSLPRKMYNREPISVSAIRFCLLGKADEEMDEGGRMFRDNNPNLSHYRSEFGEGGAFASMLSEGKGLKFGEKEFTPANMEECIRKRLDKKDVAKSLKDVEGESLAIRQSHQIIKWFFDQIERSVTTDKGKFEIRKELGDLADLIANIPPAGINGIIEESKADLDKSSVRREMGQVGVLLEQIMNLYYQGERQYQFLYGQLGPGKGVAFEFDGTIDAIRTVSNDYLGILNHSIEVESTLVKRSVRNYFCDYLEQDRGRQPGPVGQVFTQKLDRGPLTHLTIIQQASGPVELSNAFRNVMSSLERNGLTFISDTLIHPYSFIRNMLWVSTFRGEWLDRRDSHVEPNYAKSFEFGVGAIKSIFGNPESVESKIDSVKGDNDLYGIRLPSIDEKSWRDLGLLTDRGDGGTKEIQDKLEKMHYTLPDMILINYLRCEAQMNEERNKLLTGKTEMRGNLIKKLRDPGEVIEEIYPRKLWESRFKGRAFDADKVFFPIRSNDGAEETTKSDDPFGAALGISSGGSSENSDLAKVIAESDAWKDALNDWMIFIPKINPEEEEE